MAAPADAQVGHQRITRLPINSPTPAVVNGCSMVRGKYNTKPNTPCNIGIVFRVTPMMVHARLDEGPHAGMTIPVLKTSVEKV